MPNNTMTFKVSKKNLLPPMLFFGFLGITALERVVFDVLDLIYLQETTRLMWLNTISDMIFLLFFPFIIFFLPSWFTGNIFISDQGFEIETRLFRRVIWWDEIQTARYKRKIIGVILPNRIVMTTGKIVSEMIPLPIVDMPRFIDAVKFYAPKGNPILSAAKSLEAKSKWNLTEHPLRQ